MNEDTGTEKTSTSVGAGQAPDTAGQGVATSPMYGNFVSRVSVKVPPFWSDHPEIWFAQIEAQFAVSGIVADETKYSTVIAAIESQVLVQISDAVLKPPATGKYEFLKKCIIERFCESEQKKIQKLLSDMHLGDRRPTQLLNELRSLAKDRVSDDFLASLWLQRLPQNVRAILQASNAELSELAKLADKILEVSDYRQLAAVSTSTTPNEATLLQRIAVLEERLEKLGRSRSSSRSSNRKKSQRSATPSAEKFCWYHWKFGEAATKCRQPCEFHSKPKN